MSSNVEQLDNSHSLDINAYYDQTYHQYRSVWKLDTHLGIHYGYWDRKTPNLKAAVRRMNEVLAEHSHFRADDHILDMGCGIGGSSFYLSENRGLEVTGISINQRQIDLAKTRAEKLFRDRTHFICGDYLSSGLEKESFDGIWALETICHCQDKSDFIKEAHRLLKPGKTMILAEYFATQPQHNEKESMKKWLRRWAIPGLDTLDEFKSKLESEGFTVEFEKDLTRHIRKSSFYMFLASFPGFVTTEINQMLKDYGEYSHYHYRSAFWQYIALAKSYWKYHMIRVRKD
jgi:cyclopropane fatty-acyl-phospholipid synthase-like methyltransferase